MAIDMYQYDDFRLYLRDRYARKAAQTPRYSYRKFAAEAGFSNPGFFNDVIKGRRKLSGDATEKMIAVFGLNPAEADYFKLLVQYERTRDEEERRDLYKQIVSRRNRSKFTRINPALVKYYQDYRYPLIRLGIEVCDFRGDYARLGRFVDPPVPPNEVKKYVRDLCDWGLARQGPDGRYEVTSKFVEPPDTLAHLNAELNREWIRHAYPANRKFPRKKRHVSTAMVTVGDEARKLIMEKIEKFREEIYAIAEQETDPSHIMQLSIQFFPKSREE